ncbi:MAG: ABC transporter permease subunit, partial [Mycobacterium sp.]|nr:ABC transporter permease subunit [Mycobacterium sp.]
MATNVAERATVPAVTALPPTAGVKLRATAVTWSWRAFLAVLYLILFGPLVILMLFSVNDSNVLAFPLEGVTFHWYTDAFHDELLHAALVNSIVVACIVAPVCLVLGTLTAFGITRFRFGGRSAVSGLVGAPLILPWLIIGIAALMFYVRFNVDLSLNTVIATQIVCTFPLVTAIVGAQLFRFQRVQEEAAIDLGCSRMQVLRYIILPHIAPALAASAIFAFTWSFNNYEISAFTIGF